MFRLWKLYALLLSLVDDMGDMLLETGELIVLLYTPMLPSVFVGDVADSVCGDPSGQVNRTKLGFTICFYQLQEEIYAINIVAVTLDISIWFFEDKTAFTQNYLRSLAELCNKKRSV